MDGKRRRSISFTPAILDPGVYSAVRLVACAGSLFLLLAVCASAQTQGDAFASRIPPNVSANAVLAHGDPPLTESMVDLYANFEAWLMELPRTQLQRNRVSAMMIEDWKKPAEIKNDMSNLSMAAQVAQATADQREFIRCGLQPKVLQNVRADKNNPDSRLLLVAYEQAHQPIATGDPPLTESMVSRFTAYLGWVLQISLTQPLKDSLRAALLEDWKQPKEIKSDMDFLNWQVDMAGRSNEEKEYFRSRAEPEIIKSMRVDRGNPAAPWIVAAYDAAHPSIAAGNPPLTRQAADAFTELLCFMHNQGGGPRQEANQALKDSNAQLLAQNYPKLSSEQQQKLAQMPQNWAMLRVAWVKGSESDRQKMRAEFQQPAVQPGPQADPRRDAASEAYARYEAFLKKEARTVSEQELLRTATDCDTVARELRREGGEKNLAIAAAWDQAARNLRAGKQAYVNQQAATIRQIGGQQATPVTPAVQPGVQTDPRSVEGHKAEARFLALKKRDPNTVSEQELLRTAIDCDTVARELRREGGEANLANALSWDQNSRILRGGKETWVNMWAIYRARDVTSEAAARYNAFLKKDARTVSEEELLRTATDCDTVAQNQRWEGGEQNLAWAATWDQAARNLRAGKEAYVKQIAAQAANSEMLQIMQAQDRARAQQNNAQALRNVSTMNYVTRMNIVSNLGNSGYHYEVRSR
jgi:hypothetical protein